MSKHSYAVLTMAALALVACGEKKPAADTTAASSAAPPAAAATPAAIGVTIVSPKNGDTTAADVSIVLSKLGPVTIEKANSTKIEGVGHYHLFVDTTAVANGQVIPPTTKHTIHIGTGDSTFTLKGLAPGQHQVIAVIGYGDHSVMAATRDTVNFVVKK
ncbi:MAG: DUF4399 domain-containing protein [Gemmatimonadaceae bacterium]